MRTWENFLEQTASKVYYWVSSKELKFHNQPAQILPSGFQIPPPAPNSGVFSEGEQYLEKFRSLYFQDKPSRTKSSYVSESLEDAKRWIWYLLPHASSFPQKPVIYEVSISGKTHKGDGQIVNKLYYVRWKEQTDQVDAWCQRYWQGLGLTTPQLDLPEILVEGSVTIIKPVLGNSHFLKIGDTVELPSYQIQGVIDNITDTGLIHLKGTTGIFSPKDVRRIA